VSRRGQNGDARGFSSQDDPVEVNSSHPVCDRCRRNDETPENRSTEEAPFRPPSRLKFASDIGFIILNFLFTFPAAVPSTNRASLLQYSIPFLEILRKYHLFRLTRSRQTFPNSAGRSTSGGSLNQRRIPLNDRISQIRHSARAWEPLENATIGAHRDVSRSSERERRILGEQKEEETAESGEGLASFSGGRGLAHRSVSSSCRSFTAVIPDSPQKAPREAFRDVEFSLCRRSTRDVIAARGRAT